MFYKGNLQTTKTELPIELNNDSVKRWEHEKRCFKHSWKKEVINLTWTRDSSLGLGSWTYWESIGFQLPAHLVMDIPWPVGKMQCAATETRHSQTNTYFFKDVSQTLLKCWILQKGEGVYAAFSNLRGHWISFLKDHRWKFRNTCFVNMIWEKSGPIISTILSSPQRLWFGGLAKQ